MPSRPPPCATRSWAPTPCSTSGASRSARWPDDRVGARPLDQPRRRPARPPPAADRAGRARARARGRRPCAAPARWPRAGRRWASPAPSRTSRASIRCPTIPSAASRTSLDAAADHARELAEQLEHQEASVQRFLELTGDDPPAAALRARRRTPPPRSGIIPRRVVPTRASHPARRRRPRLPLRELLVTRVLSAQTGERSAVVDLLRDQARGDAGGADRAASTAAASAAGLRGRHAATPPRLRRAGKVT